MPSGAAPGAPAPWKTAGLTAAAMTAFAANSLLCRAALGGGHADAASFTALRLLGGAVALGLLSRTSRAAPSPGDSSWLPAAALFAYAACFSLAYTRIAAGVGALLLFAAVQLTMNGVALLRGERPGPLEWLGLAVSLTGLVVLTRPGLSRPDLTGACLALAAGVAWGLYSLRGQRPADAVAANAASFARALAPALLLAAAAALFGGLRLGVAGVGLALVSGAVTSGLGYAVWYAALRGLTATRAAIVQLSAPPLAAAGAVVFLGESFSARLLLASVLVLGGIALAVAAHRRALTASRC